MYRNVTKSCNRDYQGREWERTRAREWHMHHTSDSRQGIHTVTIIPARSSSPSSCHISVAFWKFYYRFLFLCSCFVAFLPQFRFSFWSLYFIFNFFFPSFQLFFCFVSFWSHMRAIDHCRRYVLILHRFSFHKRFNHLIGAEHFLTYDIDGNQRKWTTE